MLVVWATRRTDAHRRLISIDVERLISGCRRRAMKW